MKAYFKELKPLVLEQIQIASSSIQIAVAWFTDQDILNLLISKRQAGVRVILVLSNDSKNFDESYSLDFSVFKQSGGKLIVADKAFMHHKFCIIDKAILLTGSANYTYNGFHKNSESIMLTDNQEAINDFLIQFELLTGTLNEDEGVILSPLIQSLHNQIKLYNAQISWLEITLAEVEKQIELYEASYRVRFQTIIGEILWLQKIIFERKAKLTEKPESKRQEQEAQQRWESFHSAISNDNQMIEQGHDTILQEKLKQLYREAVKLCHPDSPLVKEEFREKAHQVFIKLKTAYDQNNVAALQEILNELKLGITFGNIDISAVGMDELQTFIEQLAKKVQQLANQLSVLQNDQRYILQTGDVVNLVNHFAKEEILLMEEKRVLETDNSRLFCL
jgi:hypothetical protein